MGFWAKDGSYVHDDADTEVMEAMNETQGQRYDRLHNGDNKEVKKSWAEKYAEELERERKEAKEAAQREEMWAGIKAYKEYEKEKARKEQDKKARKKAYEDAKDRFERLSSLKKSWLNFLGKGINSYNTLHDVETLDSLYRGKSK